MNIDWVQVVVALTSLTGVVLALRTARERKGDMSKVGAEAGEAAARSVDLLLEPLNNLVAKLNADLLLAKANIIELEGKLEARDREWAQERLVQAEDRRQMEAQISELRGGVMVLISQLEAANITPRWKPKTGPLVS